VTDDQEHGIGYQALPRGVPVIATGGEVVGTVDRVLDNAREHIFDGIVISTDDGRRFVDAPEVARITNRRVLLTITAADAKALPAYGGMTSSVQTSAERTGRRWMRWLRRR
jgi:hypothetical protein